MNNRDAAEQARGFARGIADFLQEQLGERLLGIYLLGSLAHGGFSARYSDIDVALISTTGVTPSEIEAMREHARNIAPDLAPRLSLFWTDHGFNIGRFPPLDRCDYLDHARPLIERAHIAPPRPSREDVRVYLRGQPLDSWREQVARITALTALDDTMHKRYLRALLYAARFLFSWHSGRMASNDDAVAFLHAELQPGVDLDLIDRAFACRMANRPPDALFGERGKLAGLLAACVKIAAA